MDQLQHRQGPLFMSKGDGEESYSRNSGLQAFINQMPLSALNEALESVTLPSESGGPVVVADLGSGPGPNTITNLALIIDKLRTRLPTGAEFKAYFTDLPGNDFNNLFQLLCNDRRAKNFYSAGIPGSYTDRLFPQSSVHVFYSSLCVHFLSKIPDAILDKDSPAYNRGSVWFYSRSAVATSYQQQALQDWKSLLQARAAELVPGGLLFFSCFGRSTVQPNRDPPHDSFYEFQRDLEEAWSQLIAEGLLTEHDLDSFNIPLYYPTIQEVEEAIASCGSSFHVLTARFQPFEVSLGEIFATSEVTALSRKYGVTWKALMTGLLEVQIGKTGLDVLFQRYEELIEKRMNTQDLKFTGQLCVVALMRK